MKPSEKIRNILLKSELKNQPEINISAGLYTAQRAERLLNAVVDYLDEEYERNKPCKCVTKGDTITMERKKKTNNNECPFCNPKPVHPLDNIAGNEQKWKEHQYHQQKHYTNDETI